MKLSARTWLKSSWPTCLYEKLTWTSTQVQKKREICSKKGLGDLHWRCKRKTNTSTLECTLYGSQKTENNMARSSPRCSMERHLLLKPSKCRSYLPIYAYICLYGGLYGASGSGCRPQSQAERRSESTPSPQRGVDSLKIASSPESRNHHCPGIENLSKFQKLCFGVLPADTRHCI